jgi:hypothetical protein
MSQIKELNCRFRIQLICLNKILRFKDQILLKRIQNKNILLSLDH